MERKHQLPKLTGMGPAHIFLIAALVAIGQAGPIYQVKSNDGAVCAQTCTENVKFDYQPGFVYEYTYNAQTTNKMNGASENAATMVIDARVEIEPVTKCDLVMRVKDVSLQNSGDILQRQDFSEALRRHPLKFSFQDGKIEDICPMNGESTWTLNIKRGILSAFQNSMDNFDQNMNITETDVVGSCLTKYNVEDNNSRIKTVQKSKDLLNCDDREAYRVAMQSIGYNVPSYVKSLPLLKSHYECKQTMDLSTNTMQKSICSEEHVFRPFSNGKSGAMTSQVQVLSFNNKKRAGRSSNEHINRRTTLLFEHQYGSDKQWNSEDKAVSKLQELCQKASDDVRPELPEMINDLISSMRQVDKEALLRIYNKVSTSNFCRLNADRPKKYFLDAIPMVGSTASVQMIQYLISRKHVSGNDAKIWLMSLSFIHHPSKEMVAAITPLLDDRDVSGNTILAVSSLASSYCNVRKDCGNDYEIVNMIKKLVQLIGNCDLRDGDNTKTVHVLRALGNIGHSNEAVSRLSQCLTRKTNPDSVRIAAIDAFRRIPCEAMRSDLMGVFRDEMEDSEIRINAYIAVMKCPTKMVLLEVQEMLEKEKSNQVGSFVWSHLTNLMETSDPHMQEIRSILQDEKLKKEFNLDNRKFSRNYEGSFFFETINTGAKVDSNVIFSSKSFLPRSANLNLTIDLFGHAINFLEVGGRVQGLEQILESYTGSNPSTRSSIKPQGLGKLQNTHVDMNMDKFAATAYIRIFGNDLQHWSEKDLKGLLPSFRSLSIMGSTSFNKNMVLVDSRMIVPTCIGIPLNLTVTATGSINLEAKASRNVAEIKPSASIQVKCEMSVDAHVTKSGLKMVSTAHTSTGAELNFDKGNVQLQFPKKKSEFFNLKTDFYTIHGETEKKQELIKDNVQRSKICTGETLKSITGLRVCQEIQFPNASRHTDAPFFPFTGPIVYDLHMINEDAPNGYKIQGKYQLSEISLSVDTPGSKLSRRISLAADLEKDSFLFMAPWRNIKMEGNLVNKNTVKSVTAKLSLDNKQEYSFFSKVDIVESKAMLKLTPSLEIKSPKYQIQSKGNVEYVSRKGLDIDMAISGSMVDPITFKGNLVNKNNVKSVTAKLSLDNKKEYSFFSKMDIITGIGMLKVTPSLEIKSPKDQIQAKGNVEYVSRTGLSLDMAISGSMVDPITLKGNIINKNTVKSITAKLSLDNNKEYSFFSKVDIVKGKDMLKVTPSLKINSPKHQIQAKGKLVYVSRQGLDLDMAISGSMVDPITLKGTLVNTNNLKSITAKLSLDNKKEYSFFSKVGIIMEGTSTLKLLPSLGIKSPKYQIQAKGNVAYISRIGLDIDMAISGSMVDTITLKVTSHVIPKQIAATSMLKIGKKQYFMTSRVDRLLTKSGFKYTPYMKVTVLGKDLLELSSEVNYDRSKMMSLDFKLDKVFSRVVSLNALISLNVGKNKNKHISKITFKSPVGNFKANGDMEKKKTGLSSRVIASYNFGTKYSDRLTLSSKVRDLSLKNSVRYSGNVELASKRKSAMNFNLKGQLAKASNHLETEFDLLYGNPKNKATNNLKFHSVINRKTKAIAREYNYALSVQHPGKNIDFQVKADHFYTATNPMRKIENTLMVQIAPHNVVKTGFLYSNVKVKGLQNSEVKASLSFPGKDINIEEKLTQLSNNAYANQVSFQLIEGQMYTVNTIYKSIGKDMTVENTLRFPNKREAKVSTILKISEGDYNAKIRFDADEQTISDKQINYMAESSVKYTMSPNSISCDASLGLMWAPNKKISASVTGTFIKGSTLNTQITFSTPFNSLENFNGQSKQSWTTKRFSSMTVVSWNTNNQMKQDVILNYPDMELKYIASSLISGKSSNIDIVLMNTGSKKTAKMIVKSDKTTFINLLMAHTKDRRQVIADGSLAFDMFAVNGRLNIGIQYDDREITSSGDGQLALPSYGVSQIGASYNLKHNSVVSSAEMSYTSSLHYYRNGKISAEITKGLPKNLNGNMQLTHNNRQLFRIDASYGRQNDNFDVSVEIIEPSGKKITTLTNLNLSAARKTSHIEIKSSYIDASVDGAFEFQAGRYFDSELRVESNGRNILMSTTYKKEVSGHKLTAKLELPDNKQIKVEGILNYENPISVSFKVNSPDFPLLTEIDIAFSHESNGRTTVTKTSVKVMPYLERTELQARLSRGYITEGSIELDTPFGSMRQAKAVLAFEGDWIKIEKIRFNAELNNNNVFEMIIFYNLKSISDFSVNMVASTSHRRFDEFLVNLKHSGGLTNLDSSLKVKIAEEFMFASKIENTHKNTLVSMKTELKDFGDWETMFIRKGYLDDMTLTLSHSIGKKDQYKVDITLKDYGTVTSAQLVAPRGIKFNVDINVDIEDINFDLESVLKCGSGDSYEFTALYNHLSKLHLKTSMPSYNGEMLMTLSGNLKSFKAQAKLTNNSDRYDMSVSNSDYYRQINAELMTPLLEDTVSFTLSGNLEEFDVKLSAKHSEDIYEIKASNGDYYRVMNFNVNFPQFQSDIHFDSDIKNSNGLLKLLVGNVKYELSFSNKNYYDEIKIAMSIPRHQLKIISDIDTKKNSINGDLRIVYNKKKFSLNGSYKNMGRKKIVKVDLKTPYFNDNLLATVVGKLRKFNVVFKLQHNKAMYELTVSNKDYYRMLDVNVNLPGVKAKLDFEGELKRFKAFTSMTLARDQYKFVVSNQNYLKGVSLKLSTPQLGNCELTLDLNGNLNDFSLVSQFTHNKVKYLLNVLRNSKTGVHAITVTAPTVSLSGKLTGSLKTFNFESAFILNNDKYELVISNKNYIQQINARLSTPQTGLQKLTAKISKFNGQILVQNNNDQYECIFSFKDNGFTSSLSLPNYRGNAKVKFNGDIKNFNFESDFILNNDRYELIFSNKNYIEQINARLSTPQTGLQKLTAKISKFNGQILVQNNNNKYECIFSFKDNEFTSSLSLSNYRGNAKVKFDGDIKNFNFESDFILNNDRYELIISNKNYIEQINARLSTPQTGLQRLTAKISKFNGQILVQNNNNKYECIFSFKDNEFTSSLSLPNYRGNAKVKFDGDIKNFNFESDFILNNDRYGLIISNKNYIEQINARLSTPQTGLQKLTAKISKFNGQILVQNNNNKYECIFSFKDNEFTSSLSLPNYRGNAKVKFDGDVKNFNFVMQFVNNGKTYEMSASNNNFMGMKAHIATPHWDDIDIIVDNKGNLKNGQSHVKLSFGEHFLENNAVMQMDQSRFSFGLATSNMVLRKSAKLNMNVEFSYRTKVLKQSFDIDMNGWKASSKSSIDVSRGVVATISMRVPYYGQSELKVNITPLRLDSITATVSLKSVISGDIIVEYEHSLAGGSFTSKGHIEDGSYGRVAGYNMDISFGGDFVYDVQLDWKNSRRNIKSKGMLSFQNRKTVGTFQLQTPFVILTDLSVSGQFEISRCLEFSVTLPKQKYAIDMNWSRKSVDVIINLNMDMQNKNKQYKIVTSYRNADQTAVISRDITVKLVHPLMTLTTTSQLKKTSNMILMSGDFSWGQEQGEKIGAELRLQSSNKYEARLKMMTPRRNIEVTSSVQIRGDRYTAMALLSLDAERKSDNIEVHADIMNYGNRKDIDLTIKFPNQKNGMRLKTSVTGREGNSIFSSRSEFSIDQDPRKTLKVESKLTDDNNNYTLELIAEHPQSNLAFDMLAFVAVSSDRYNTGMELNYMNYKRQQQHLMVRGQIHKLRRELNFEFEGPSKTIQLSSSVRTGNHYQISMNKKENGMKDMTATASVNPISRNMHVELNYDQANPDRFLHLDAGVVKNTLMFKTYRTKGQKKISNDGRLSIKLRPSSVLLFQMNWNPALLTELNNYGFATLNSYGMEMRSVGEMVARTVSNEASVKMTLMKTAFSEEFQPMIRYFSTEYESLYRDIARQLVKLSDIYSKNHFYLTTINNSLGSAWNMMWTNYQYGIEAMNMKIDTFNKVMSDKMGQAKKDIDRFYSQIGSVYQLNKNNLFGGIDDVIQYMQDQYNSGYERMILIQQEISSYINRYPAIIKRLIEQMKEHPYGVMVADTMMDIYQILYDQKAAVNQQIISLRHYTVMEILSSAYNKVYQQALWQVKESILGLKDRISKFVDNEVKLMKRSLSDLDMKTLVIDPTHGVIKIEIRFGGVMTAYNHIESIVRTIDDISLSLKKYSDMIPSSNWTIYDVYYMMKPSSDVNNWIPPFKAQATLFGGQHITTFDGRHLDYKGTCSYLLTRDFVDGNFTVVVNYHPDERQRMIKSITVTTALNEQVDIYSDYKVQFNGRVARLPLKLVDASIYRSGDDIIMAGLRGYRVTCNPKLNMYTVDISGWYFNRVAGLFGSYNNEQFDDMTMSNMKYTNDLGQFAMSWSVSKSCRSHHNFAHDQMVAESRECAHMFLEPSSPFRNCFRQVNPDSFYHTCATQSNNTVSNQKVICDVSAYYIKQCQGREVFMQLPVHCGAEIKTNHLKKYI